MEIKFSEIPTTEAIAAMSPEEKQTAVAALEEATLDKAIVYRITEMNRVRMQKLFDDAYAEFQEQHRVLIDNLNDNKTHAASEREFLQQAAVAHHQLTGDKTWKAFQAAESWKPMYDPKAMLDWALYEAPGMIREKLVSLNTKAADALVLESVNGNGVPKPATEYLMAIMPAIAYRTYTGKILSKELEGLVADKPSPEAAPEKLVEPVGSASDYITLLTQDEVGKAVTNESFVPPALQRALAQWVDETSTPRDPIPAVVVDEDEEAYLGASTLAKLRTAAMEADDNAADTSKVPF